MACDTQRTWSTASVVTIDTRGSTPTLEDRRVTIARETAFVIAIMNMILYGIEAPNILHTNTLTENLADIQEKDRYDSCGEPALWRQGRGRFSRTSPSKPGRPPSSFYNISSRSSKRADAEVSSSRILSFRIRTTPQRVCGSNYSRACNRHTVLDCRADVPGGGREDGGAVLRKRQADSKGLVLPTEPWPQPRQNESVERC